MTPPLRVPLLGALLALCCALAGLAGLPAARAASDDPRASANPCAAYQASQRSRRAATPAERRIAGRPFLYNGVDKLIAPMDQPIRLSPEYAGDRSASCVVFEVVFGAGSTAIQQANPVAVYPPVRSDMMAARQQSGADVLRQIPFARVLANKPVPNVPQLVAVPLWPAHPFYANDAHRIAGPASDALRDMGYPQAERISAQGDLAAYKVFERVSGDAVQAVFVVLRTWGEREPILTLREVTEPGPAGPLTKQMPEGPVADAFDQAIRPWMERQPARTLNAEVRHYARGYRIPHDRRNTSASLNLALDPGSQQPADHPLITARHTGQRVPGTIAVRWGHDVLPPAFANIAELRPMLAEAQLTKEERARRAQTQQQDAEAADRTHQAALDARQRDVRGRRDPNNPLAGLGYPNASTLITDGATTYYLSEARAESTGMKDRVVIALHEVGVDDPVLELEPGGRGSVRYAQARVAFVRERLAPPTLARWPDLSRLVVQHHVRGMPLEDTAEFRRAGARGYGYDYDQPLFEEVYARNGNAGPWLPEYELERWTRARSIDLALFEFSPTVAEAHVLRAQLKENARFAKQSPDERRAALRARRAKTQAERSPHYVYKSDRFWASLPRSYMAQEIFAGDFSRPSLQRDLPDNYRQFVQAYSDHCLEQIKRGPYKVYILKTRRVTLDGYGNVQFQGVESETRTYVEARFVEKYDAYETHGSMERLLDAAGVLFAPGEMAAFGAKFLSTPPRQLAKDLMFKPKAGAGAGAQGLISRMLGVSYSWVRLVRSDSCTGPTVYQLRENMYRAAHAMPSLQAAGIRVANAASESQPMVPPPGEATIFDGCYNNLEFKSADYCMCMDMQSSSIMRADERRKYAADFERYYSEIVFPDKGGVEDSRWRLYEMQRQCTR